MSKEEGGGGDGVEEEEGGGRERVEKEDAWAVHQCNPTAAGLAEGGGWIVEAAKSADMVNIFETSINWSFIGGRNV